VSAAEFRLGHYKAAGRRTSHEEIRSGHQEVFAAMSRG
jgi:hypothetical protein